MMRHARIPSVSKVFNGARVLLFAVLLSVPRHSASAEDVTSSIRLNTVGYLPDTSKSAAIAGACTSFTVVKASDGQTAFEGKVTGPVTNQETTESLYIADFSGLTAEGEYQLDVPGVGRSAPFRVAKDLYNDTFYTVERSMYLWRCGTAVRGTNNGQVFAHGACHTNDGWLDFVGGGHTRKDGTGGWHDAGDYNKYVVNAGITVGTMLRAWEDFGPQLRRINLDIPESGGTLPDYLAEIKWELDWLLKMQADDGSLYHKLSTKRFGGFVMPEAETTDRYFSPWGSEATAQFVGTMAQAARVFRPYDRDYAHRCLQAARRSYLFLNAHPEHHKPDQSGFQTGPYEIDETRETSHRVSGVPNNRLWAEAEVWETTGAPDMLRELETHIKAVGGQVNFLFDWDEVKDLGLITYLASKRPGRDPALVSLVRLSLLSVADEMVRVSANNVYGSPAGSNYCWGYNGFVARQSLVLITADRLWREGGKVPGSVQSRYQAACLNGLNFLFGHNYYGRSFVTGIGFRPPMHPHDRRSAADKVAEPWPGYLVGGAQPKATDWRDVQGDAGTNEIAINWNAALIYALAACLQP